MKTTLNGYGGFMGYRIVVDSCCELQEQYKNDDRFRSVPLQLEVGDYKVLDDENFNQKEFIEKVASSPECPRSACPSPETFMEAYRGDEEEVFVVTLSSHLSGSYNSAEVGKDMYMEKFGADGKKIHVVDSESASCGETQLAMMIMQCKDAGMSFEDTVKKVEDFKLKMRTYFVLDNLETFRKNGRLTGVKAMMVSSLNIKPVMVGARGSIEQRGQAIGTNKALTKMADYLLSDVSNPRDRVLMITHCNCPDRAEYMRELLVKRASYKDIVVMDMAGVSTMYANDGGVIVTL